MIDILNVEMKIAENPKVRELLFPQPGNISSLPSSLAIQMLGNPGASYQEMIDFFQNLNQSQLDGILMNAPPEVAKFLTKDFQENKEKGVIKAKGTLILVMLNATKYDEIKGDKNPILDGDEEILKIFDSTEFSGVKRMGLIEDEYVSKEIDEESGGVMGFLFMMVVFLIIGILFLTYKSVFDSIISLLALLFAIVWMNGIGVLLGLTFTTMSESVRIMLMGLGIDYGIHIVMRYREERLQHRKKIAESLVLTTASVGTALFLATLTTSLSFGSNMVSEIKPMREFAIFAVVGIFSAFIIMVTFVPASKQIYHSWQEKRDIKEFKKKATKDVDGLSAFTEKGKRGVPKGTDTVLTRILAKGAVAAEH
ncbi:MAG TPA: hypothetical protein EYP29_02835, partial [Thermoplasmata archaeon]|nr:hypothetical protein [Thermoplasmata archaeon]